MHKHARRNVLHLALIMFLEWITITALVASSMGYRIRGLTTPIARLCIDSMLKVAITSCGHALLRVFESDMLRIR